MPSVNYIEFDGTEHCVDVAVGETVMQGARRNGIPGIDADCGGVCACATCHVYVDDEWREAVGAPGEDEKEMLECATGPGPASRLSCQITMTDALNGLTVQMPLTQR